MIDSPMEGAIVKLDTLSDEAFSSKSMGDGIAVIPKIGRVIAPFDCNIDSIFPTNHALGITSNEGIELMIHVGIDTVKLEGKHFKAFVKNDDKVKKGDTLIEFDIANIIKEGFDIVTPIIVSNTENYLDIIGTDNKEIKFGEQLIKIVS